MASTNALASQEPQPFNYVDEDTLAQLRSVGTRVRKSVTEGFQRTVSVPADPFSASKRLPFTQTPSFISANDAMRDIFAQRGKNAKGSSSVPSSPQQHAKRAHGPEGDDSDVDVEPLDEDLDLDLGEEDTESAAAVRAKREVAAKLQAEKAKREIRPLKRSASRGVATQSLPASMFRFSHEASNTKPAPSVAKIAEEDDWSESFGGSGGVPTAELQL
ncbi:hypothetical protein L226DRAFT_529634 [Lentinus tigrinus ALCF2SS1-7]|uniref:Uncharacterized protein n=1 Tax=Lentinus tigrinus ALCF2SS1-6 TaxID=1328759 RepID=A0A5C2STP4_9APHY|nr:hypothetical protein L227DRAFT_569432 [Lentinus tigrinus ALCF2SS1-6]RPD81216.1 hypothetical protein L226DRAFT_529634 [Lentinus tigrinus ALCF2SS1-7]